MVRQAGKPGCWEAWKLGCRILDAGCWILDEKRRMAQGARRKVTGYWMRDPMS